MRNLIEMQQEWKSAVDEMKTLIDLAETEKRDLTADEEKKYNEFDKQSETLKSDIEKEKSRLARIEKVSRMAEDAGKIQKKMEIPNVHGSHEDKKEFRSLGEFVYTFFANPSDERLAELREQSMGTGVKGGIMIPTVFRDTLMEVNPLQAVLRARCSNIPTEGDAPVEIPVLDQSPTKGRLAGVTVNWVAEGGAKPETDASLKKIELTPHEVAAHVVMTDKLLRNWPACEALLTRLIRGGITNAIETAILTGSGVGQPKGVYGSGAVKMVTRAGATSITYADVSNMFTEFFHDGNAQGVWFANQTILPKLMALKDESSALIWQPNARDGNPGTMFGMPVVWNNRAPILGNPLDLMLADMSYYAICEGSGPYVGLSEHVYWTSNKTALKVFTNIDGMPWLSTTVPLSDTASTVTVSPFIYLST